MGDLKQSNNVKLMTSNENTPFKATKNQAQNQNQVLEQQFGRSPIEKQSHSNNRLFEDRSISFLRSSDKKNPNVGYNTDDLIRDSESEVDLDKVSSILQDAQLNLKDGLNYILQ